jgi:hypothetical protein
VVHMCSTGADPVRGTIANGKLVWWGEVAPARPST